MEFKRGSIPLSGSTINPKFKNMKTLSTFKAEYKKAKTQKGKTSTMNRAMLNLSHDDQQKFVKWQSEEMNKEFNEQYKDLD